jgi:ubiquinone biosynthesis protein
MRGEGGRIPAAPRAAAPLFAPPGPFWYNRSQPRGTGGRPRGRMKGKGVVPRFPWRGPLVEITRARHIAEVLIRNGLGFLAESLGLTRFLPRGRKRTLVEDRSRAVLSMPERVRRTLEELGPTYIKLGQILSTRPDILPPAYIIELSKLLDAAPPVPVDAVIATIEHELQAPLPTVFATFTEQPIASASIGQVHRATLHDGTAVVVKVRRPSVERTIEADLQLLLSQARFLEGRSETLRHYQLVDIVGEFAQALRDELDYTIEGRNADRLRDRLGDGPVRIPTVYWPYTTRRVITLSEIEGHKLSESERLVAEGYDLHSVAVALTRAYLDQVFVHGIFHADPHPANILVTGQQLGLVDFGVVGHLTRQVREALGDLLYALVEQSADDMVYVIMRLAATPFSGSRDALRRDVQRLLARYYDVSLQSVPIAEFLGEVMGVAFRHRLRLPADLALLARTVVVLEGVARSLDPTIVLAEYLEPFVVPLVRERYAPRRLVTEAVRSARDLEELLRVMPRRVDLLSEQLGRGELTLGIDVRSLGQALRKLDAVVNRLAFSVVVAAIIVGSALILAAGERAAMFRLPFVDANLPVAQLGFVVAGLLGAWLLFSIIRSRGL